jgi:hypothetical protein
MRLLLLLLLAPALAFAGPDVVDTENGGFTTVVREGSMTDGNLCTYDSTGDAVDCETTEATPSAHAASHAAAGSDPIAPADIGAAAVGDLPAEMPEAEALAGTATTARTIAAATLAAAVAEHAPTRITARGTLTRTSAQSAQTLPSAGTWYTVAFAASDVSGMSVGAGDDSLIVVTGGTYLLCTQSVISGRTREYATQTTARRNGSAALALSAVAFQTSAAVGYPGRCATAVLDPGDEITMQARRMAEDADADRAILPTADTALSLILLCSQ